MSIYGTIGTTYDEPGSAGNTDRALTTTSCIGSKGAELSISDFDRAYQILVDECGTDIANASRQWIDCCSDFQDISMEAIAVHAAYWFLSFNTDCIPSLIAGLDDIAAFMPRRRDVAVKGYAELISKGIIPRKPALNTRTEGFIYLAYSRDLRLFKIGCSINPFNRRAQLQKELGVRVQLIAALATNDMGGAEAEAHAVFIKDRVHGEWFQFNFMKYSEIVEALTNIARYA